MLGYGFGVNVFRMAKQIGLTWGKKRFIMMCGVRLAREIVPYKTDPAHAGSNRLPGKQCKLVQNGQSTKCRANTILPV